MNIDERIRAILDAHIIFLGLRGPLPFSVEGVNDIKLSMYIKRLYQIMFYRRNKRIREEFAEMRKELFPTLK